jgi:hypothetical protein
MSYRADDAKSLDLVQRWVISTLLIVVGGAPTCALAAYSNHLPTDDRSSAIGLWVMSCVLGLFTAGGVLVIHRRFPVSPLLIVGLVPSLIGAYYLFLNG